MKLQQKHVENLTALYQRDTQILQHPTWRWFVLIVTETLLHLCVLQTEATDFRPELTNEVVDSVAHHVCRLGGAVKPKVLGHRLLLLGGLAHLLQEQRKKNVSHAVFPSDEMRNWHRNADKRPRGKHPYPNLL